MPRAFYVKQVCKHVYFKQLKGWEVVRSHPLIRQKLSQKPDLKIQRDSEHLILSLFD